MDFLDPKKYRRNQLVLLVGYGLITIAIAIAALILLYQTSGYGVNKEGQVIQNGLVFVSSQPPGARIYLNGQAYKGQTNTKLKLPSGDYELKLAADGYREWKRQITVNGDDVQHFDYPFLFPTVLTKQSRMNFSAQPAFTSQSPDRRWLIVKPTADTLTLRRYDLRNPSAPDTADLSLEGVATEGDGTWAAVEWSTDNRHLLLRHDYSAGSASKHEYIMLDRADPTASVNLSRTVTLGEGEALSLFNKKPTQFYAFDAAAGTLRTLSTDDSLTPKTMEHVVAFKSYSDDTLLYATTAPQSGTLPEGMVGVELRRGDKTYPVRNLPVSDSYSLDIADYSGDEYVILGAASDTAVYLYRDLHNQQLTTASSLPKPWRRFPIKNLAHVGFSSTAQFITAESGQEFWVYDADPDLLKSYHYTTAQPLDDPQTHAVWMDGSHLTYVSGGRQIVFDYDYQNVQTLQAALPAYLPAFDPDYSYVYNVSPGASENTAVLYATPLTTVKQ